MSVDGLRLRVVRAGEGPPLLLVNGIGAPAEMWAPLAWRLGDRDLVAFDLPGTGSSPPAARPRRMRGLAQLVTRLLEALRLDAVDVLGYSYGGMVAQELALRSPGQVRRLVLCATVPGLGAVPPRPLATMMMLSPVRYSNRVAARYIVPVIAGGRSRRDAASLEEQMALRLANPPSTRGYLEQMYAMAGWSSLPWLRLLRQPTMILHGDDDPVAPLANARMMAAIMPHARLRIVPRAGHLFLLDEPESVVDELKSFTSRSLTR